MPTTFPILVIDDEPGIVDILRRAAKSTFPEAEFIGISTFVGAARYLSELTGRGPRLVLLDIDLQSERSGLDFLTLLRAHPQGRLLPIVLLSGKLDKVATNEAYMRGANAVTSKAYSFEEWKSYVQNLRAYWFNVVLTPNLYFFTDKKE